MAPVKLIGKGETFLAFLRRTDDPSLTGGGGVGATFLWRIFGLHKLIEEGVHTVAFLRRICDPPLTGGSVHYMA